MTATQPETWLSPTIAFVGPAARMPLPGVAKTQWFLTVDLHDPSVGSNDYLSLDYDETCDGVSIETSRSFGGTSLPLYFLLGAYGTSGGSR